MTIKTSPMPRAARTANTGSGRKTGNTGSGRKKPTTKTYRGFTHESTNAGSVEWYTPKYIFDALGVEFDLDPCSPSSGRSHVPAKTRYSLASHGDGLAQPWFGTVWCNPPYGKETAHWLRRLAEHGDGIALVFARTEVKWFHEIANRITAVCFIAGRVKFHEGDIDVPLAGAGGCGSMLIAFGEKAADALRRSGLGLTMIPSQVVSAPVVADSEDAAADSEYTGDSASTLPSVSPVGHGRHAAGAPVDAGGAKERRSRGRHAAKSVVPTEQDDASPASVAPTEPPAITVQSPVDWTGDDGKDYTPRLFRPSGSTAALVSDMKSTMSHRELVDAARSESTLLPFVRALLWTQERAMIIAAVQGDEFVRRIPESWYADIMTLADWTDDVDILTALATSHGTPTDVLECLSEGAVSDIALMNPNSPWHDGAFGSYGD